MTTRLSRQFVYWALSLVFSLLRTATGVVCLLTFVPCLLLAPHSYRGGLFTDLCPLSPCSTQLQGWFVYWPLSLVSLLHTATGVVCLLTFVPCLLLAPHSYRGGLFTDLCPLSSSCSTQLQGWFVYWPLSLVSLLHTATGVVCLLTFVPCLLAPHSYRGGLFTDLCPLSPCSTQLQGWFVYWPLSLVFSLLRIATGAVCLLSFVPCLLLTPHSHRGGLFPELCPLSSPCSTQLQRLFVYWALSPVLSLLPRAVYWALSLVSSLLPRAVYWVLSLVSSLLPTAVYWALSLVSSLLPTAVYWALSLVSSLLPTAVYWALSFVSSLLPTARGAGWSWRCTDGGQHLEQLGPWSVGLSLAGLSSHCTQGGSWAVLQACR